ncbi:MAG: hypothetical protein HY334_07995, partial [Armatimonadetes bacterium]|nr:hypothetical protein [Armatimonadota bacterium]
IQTGARDGMQSLDQHLKTLLKLRKIDQDEAVKRAEQPDAFLQDRGAPAGMEVLGLAPRRP